jgi:hypothetical protein
MHGSGYRAEEGIDHESGQEREKRSTREHAFQGYHYQLKDAPMIPDENQHIKSPSIRQGFHCCSLLTRNPTDRYSYNLCTKILV